MNEPIRVVITEKGVRVLAAHIAVYAPRNYSKRKGDLAQLDNVVIAQVAGSSDEIVLASRLTEAEQSNLLVLLDRWLGGELDELSHGKECGINPKRFDIDKVMCMVWHTPEQLGYYISEDAV